MYKAYIREVNYVPESDMVLIVAEYLTDEGATQRFTYQEPLTISVDDIRAIIFSKADQLNTVSKPSLVIDLESLIDTEITE